MTRKSLIVGGVLLLGSVFVAALAPAEALEAIPGRASAVNVGAVSDGAGAVAIPNVYVPMLAASGGPAQQPAADYAAALSRALSDCAGTRLNQVCYGGGKVTLDGGGALTAPGQAANLDGVSGLTLVSPDADHWSVALLRLASDSATPDLGLTLLAFGNVTVRNLTLFAAAAGNGDVAPALSFSSSPVPGQDPETGGLLVYNPTQGEPLSINLNGADLTLFSSAVVQARPGSTMTVTMATGSALVSTADGDNVVTQAHQLSVPLNGSGAAAGAPTTPTVTDDDLLEPLVPRTEDDLLVPLVRPHPPSPLDIIGTIEYLIDEKEVASYRCNQGDARQVYRLMYFVRVLREYQRSWPLIFPDGGLDGVDAQVRQCATFEIEFNSDVTVTSLFASGTMYVQGQGMVVSFGLDGRLIQPAQMPLTHRRYDMRFPEGLSVVLSDGRLSLSEGSMRINRNHLDISTKMMPVDVSEQLFLCCPEPFEVANGYSWFTTFTFLHASEQVLTGFVFTPAHWKYTGGLILAEAIFSREVPFMDGVVKGDTWLVMIHKPGQ